MKHLRVISSELKFTDILVTNEIIVILVITEINNLASSTQLWWQFGEWKVSSLSVCDDSWADETLISTYVI